MYDEMSGFGKWFSHPPAGEELVISGISGRLPASDNIYEFRDNLFSKRDMMSDDERRWKLDHPEIPNRTGKINDIDKFDGGFFGVHHALADFMDPLTRIVLEKAVEAIMDAGINPAELHGSRTGVFIAGAGSETEIAYMMEVSKLDRLAVLGYFRLLLPNRISYHLKLKGPSTGVDTGCSSSLVAINCALQALRNGDCDNAVVAGVGLILHPGVTLHFFRLGALSRDAVCKVFDQSANGYGRAEAAACILLQKRKDARRVYSQVLHCKVNDDGFTVQGITYPSSQMQSQLITEMIEEGGFDVNKLQYCEAHGSGTEVGDLQEVASIDKAIAQKRQKKLLIGSVKSNMGHSEPVSGLCAIFKVILAMETGLIPPNINFKNVRKELAGLAEGRMQVVTEPTPLEEDAFVGINNFGFGGANSHLLLKPFEKRKLGHQFSDNLPRLVCASGRTHGAVSAFLDDVNQRPLDAEYVGLLHQLFKTDFEQHNYRGFTVVSKNGSIRKSVTRFDRRQAPWHVYLGEFTKSFRVFGQHLLQYQCFKDIVQNINAQLKGTNLDIVEVIKKRISTKNDAFVSVVVQIAFLMLLKLLGVLPSRVSAKSLEELWSSYFNDEFIKSVCQPFTKLLVDSTSEQQTEKPVVVLNLSDEIMNSTSVQMVDDNNEVSLLEILGRLYQEGYNPQIHKLYPEIQFPVSRGTPMISPLVKWNHNKSWKTYKFSSFGTTEQQRHSYSILTDDHKYIMGHVVDGRELFPATEYLNVVWKTLASNISQAHLPVVFENCRFLKALALPASGNLQVFVSIQRSNGQFEVLDQSSSLLANGRIFVPDDITHYQTRLPRHEVDFEDGPQMIDHKDIYRELNLRGYNYSGSFKGFQKCTADVSVGLIRWENNWTTFMDMMLQSYVFQWDTRSLYVPTNIRRLSIDPKKHLEFASKQIDGMCPLYVHEQSHVVKSGGVEIVGLEVTAISKRSEMAHAVLEKHVFVPYSGRFDLATALRIIGQVIFENSLEPNLRAAEIQTNQKSDSLLPLLAKILDDFPKISAELFVTTTDESNPSEDEDYEKIVLTPTSNLILILGTNLLRIPATRLFDALNPFGFVLSREDIDFVPQSNEHVQILLDYETDNEKLVLYRKRRSPPKRPFVEMKSNDLTWIPKLQSALDANDDNVVIFARNERHNGVLGFLTCLRLETKIDRVKCVFAMDDAPDFDPQHPFYRDQLNKDLAVNIFKNGFWGSYRHLLLENAKEVESEHCYVVSTKRGDLSSLKWVEGPLTRNSKLGENEIMVYPYYSAVNFKDLMTATGRVTADSVSKDRIIQETLQGMEFSGRDASGRRVFGYVTHRALSTMIAADQRYLIDVPDSWSLEEAATLFVVYGTVLYILLEMGKLRKNASILIHSGTGGVGMAALNICQHFECDVFVTVGTQEKREYILKNYPHIPESHIGNSRDTSFEIMVKKETRGRGVDFVLNSLAGDKLMASVRCLAAGGSFLEIGKFDIEKNTDLSLLMFEKNISFHGLMLDRMNSHEDRMKISELICDGMKKGFVKPLPTKIFQRHQIEEAFRHKKSSTSIGKVLIEIRKEERELDAIPQVIRSRATSRLNCDASKSYIIIGGLGGLGLELADWLYLRGAKKIVLVSRSGIKTGYQTMRIKNWNSYGVTVKVSTTNTTTKEGCYQLFKEANALGPVDGIFNLAVVEQDGAFYNLSEELFSISLAPKAYITQHLDELSRELCPDLKYFVVFSSGCCSRGNGGQTSYGTANSVMERICEQRKLDGLPALAIQWGAIGEVGAMVRKQKDNKGVEVGGTIGQKVASCLEVLEKFLKQDNPVVGSIVIGEKTKRSTDSPVEAVAYILGIKDVKSVGYYKSLPEVGMDSISSTEIVQILEKDFGIFVTVQDLRTFTFASLMEIETEQQNVDKNANAKEFIASNKPEIEAEGLRIERMSSAVTDAKQTASTVLVFPGMNGRLSQLEPIVTKLNAHVFGVHFSYYKPEETFQEIARKLLPQVQSILPCDKTFNIIAYSYGACVAQELIGLLETRGYTGRLVAIDGSVTYTSALFRGLFPGKRDAQIETSVLVLVLSTALSEVEISPKIEKMQQMMSFKDRLAFVKSTMPIDETLEQVIITMTARIKAILGYKYEHAKIKSSVRLLKAEFQSVRNIASDYGFSEVCQNPVDLSVIKGDHVTMLDHPSLITHLKEYLQM